MRLNTHEGNYSGLRVLLLQLEFPSWYRTCRWAYSDQVYIRGGAQTWSYNGGLGIEEGLGANGVQYLTITTPWFSRVREICAGKQFDQVWLEIGRHDFLGEKWLGWVASLAPIRIGFMPESLEYNPEDYALNPALKKRKQEVERRLSYVTHVVIVDEKDADDINARGLVPAMWWPQAVPERFICEQATPVPNKHAVFCGNPYGERVNWLRNPHLKGLLVRPSSPEKYTVYPVLFEALHLAVWGFLKSRLPGTSSMLAKYLYFLRYIRQQCFVRWLKVLQTGCAVVNLPHLVKGYAGRVVEGMAAGRPVISWEIPDRPQNRGLFEDGQEILLYSNNEPSQLAAHIRRILSESEFGPRIAANARRKLRRSHTMERRVRQILDWIATGEAPTFS